MNGVSKLTVTEQVSLVFFERLPADGGNMSRLLNTLAKEGVNIDMISQSAPCAHHVSLSFTIADS
ncbi:MAG: aspartate kinase, partial [Oscillospiraceae bacterium]